MKPGVSGMSVYVPSLRVPLEAWSQWTGNPWPKVQAVVGNSFRCPAPRENVYTMAAHAVLRLIREYDVDPQSVGHLALGTETSTDNSAGAIIVRGMVDRALVSFGLPRLSRNCEVPEFKHACLAGVYALKAAARYVTADGSGRRAIVVCADIAEYERGSTGEQTQGAGAVAMLVDAEPQLFSLDLEHAGSGSDYRGPDFRKPHARHFMEGYAESTKRLHDFPVFSGKYSTFAYLEETSVAFRNMVERLGKPPLSVLDDADAFFFHRPYQHMPVQAMAHLYVSALLESESGRSRLQALCKANDISLETLEQQVHATPDLFQRVLEGKAEEDPTPAASRIAGALRKTDEFQTLLKDKMSLGSDGSRELGNLYTAALFAWMAAGFEEALETKLDLTGQNWITMGYGSGDAAEAIPVTVAPGWADAARKIRFRDALKGARDLSLTEYEALHDGGNLGDLSEEPRTGFRIHRVGDQNTASYQDIGVEYYEYVNE